MPQQHEDSDEKGSPLGYPPAEQERYDAYILRKHRECNNVDKTRKVD